MRMELQYQLTVDDVDEYRRAQASGKLGGQKLARARVRLVGWLIIILVSLTIYAALELDCASSPHLLDQLRTVFFALLPFGVIVFMILLAVIRNRFTKAGARGMMAAFPYLAVPRSMIISDSAG